jgi:hypothetical protein
MLKYSIKQIKKDIISSVKQGIISKDDIAVFVSCHPLQSILSIAQMKNLVNELQNV